MKFPTHWRPIPDTCLIPPLYFIKDFISLVNFSPFCLHLHYFPFLLHHSHCIQACSIIWLIKTKLNKPLPKLQSRDGQKLVYNSKYMSLYLYYLFVIQLSTWFCPSLCFPLVTGLSNFSLPIHYSTYSSQLPTPPHIGNVYHVSLMTSIFPNLMGTFASKSYQQQPLVMTIPPWITSLLTSLVSSYFSDGSFSIFTFPSSSVGYPNVGFPQVPVLEPCLFILS